MARLDEAGFSAFYASHARSLWAYAYRVSGHAADADDIVQEAFLRFLRSEPDAADETERRRYLFKIAGNLLVDRWRRSRTEFRAGEMRQADMKSASTDATVGADVTLTRQHPVEADVTPARQRPVGADFTSAHVAKTFKQLSPRERALLWLAYVEDESHAEIADAIGVAKGSVKVLLFRARHKLRDLLQASGWTGER